MTKKISNVNSNVKAYYEKNWEFIANCYELDQDGYPIDSAWYRRQIYLKLLRELKAQSVLDIGCGGGRTVLDALEFTKNVIGIEPIHKLVEYGQETLRVNGQSENHIIKGDASYMVTLPSQSKDLVSLLSVMPHIDASDWDSVHSEIFRILKPEGHCIIAYRNELFDLYTENSFTFDFFMNNFFVKTFYSDNEMEILANNLKNFIPFHQKPGANHTNSKDKSFGNLNRPRTNPLTHAKYLANHGLKLQNIYFCNFHPFLPNMELDSQKFREVKHQLENNWSNSWQGYFMSSMFVIVARRQ